MSFNFDPNMLKGILDQTLQAQDEIANARFEGTAGGGAVKIVMTGAHQVLSIELNPDAVNKEGIDLLQDMIVAAFNDVQEKIRQKTVDKFGGMTGGMNLPGFPPSSF
jgi:nucleoid-associated protein EbfC